MSDLKQLKEQLKSLSLQREVLEIEADAIFSELTSVGVNGEPPAGLKGSLIDEEGFPRGDIDIYNVRNKRRRLAEINTDHKILMKTMEGLTTQIFEISRNTFLLEEQEARKAEKPDISPPIEVISNVFPKTVGHLIPMAILDEVLDLSPASQSGIKNGDLLLKFGSIVAEDSSALQSIARLVGSSVEKPIDLLIKRNEELIEMTLIPRTWGGRGLLGCHLTPFKR